MIRKSGKFYITTLSLIFILCGCELSSDQSNSGSLIESISNLESINGSQEYLNSPFVAAGDRVYLVGHQDGSFPDLGWHIDGEMGGLWDHPIKLMDGFSLNISDTKGLDWCLDAADSFTNYAFGNLHSFSGEQVEVQRFQFVPEGREGIVIEYAIENKTDASISLTLNFTGHVDLRPTWLAERKNIVDGTDEGEFDPSFNGYVVKDSSNPWYLVFGSQEVADASEPSCSMERKGNGRDFSLKSEVELAAKSKRYFRYYIAGSYTSEKEALTTFEALKNDSQDLLDKKVEQYDQLNSTNQLLSGDKGIDQMYRWIKYNTQWLVRDVPEFGRGVSAGIPDYPWWFGTDNAYILQGLASAGFHEEALNTIDLIMKFSRNENGNGKIVHEVSSNGIVFNPGNLNTTPSFISALWKVYEWTGNERIIDEYYEDIIKGIEWIEGMDKDQNGYPDGAGMMEIHGLDSEMIDVVAYLYQAYTAAANFAEIKGDADLSDRYNRQAEMLKEKINSEWWVPEANSFADFRSSHEKFMETLIATKIRIDTLEGLSQEILESMKKEVDTRMRQANTMHKSEEIAPYVIHHNWVVNTPMEVGAASTENALVALETAKDYRSRFGMYVTGVDKKEEQEEATKWKAFSYVSAVMTLPTGVQAISEAAYGDSDDALEYLKMLENSFSYALPGSMYEVSPDFGMIAQGWNIYAVAVPIVDHFFGIKPQAFHKKITISPQMPAAWNEAKLDQVKIGDNEISISFERNGTQELYKINQKLDWKIEFNGGDNQQAIIN